MRSAQVVSAGLTYGKTLGKAVEIGTRLAASVITSSENVWPALPPGRVRHRGIEGGRNEVTVRNRQPGQTRRERHRLAGLGIELIGLKDLGGVKQPGDYRGWKNAAGKCQEKGGGVFQRASYAGVLL